MRWEEQFLNLSRFLLHGIALIVGGLAILFLWISFFDPPAASFAVVFLATAAGITLGLPAKPGLRPRRRS